MGSRWIHRELGEAAPPALAQVGRAACFDYRERGCTIIFYQDGKSVGEHFCNTANEARGRGTRWVEEGLR